RRRALPGTAISTSCRCLEMSIATRRGETGIVLAMVMAGLLCSVVRKTTVETRDPAMATCCAILKAAQEAIAFPNNLLPDVLRHRVHLQCHSGLRRSAQDRLALYRPGKADADGCC